VSKHHLVDRGTTAKLCHETLDNHFSREGEDASLWTHLQTCFEVSAHTGRVHFHLAEDGSNPLGLSLPLDLLLMAGTPSSLRDLLAALDNRSALDQGVFQIHPYVFLEDFPDAAALCVERVP
jgi:hypothetical protein